MSVIVSVIGRRHLMPAILALTLVMGGFAGWAPTADAQSTPTTTGVPSTINRGVVGAGALGDIVPEPGSGRAPQLDGERGSRSQLIAFAALAGGLLIVGSLASRDIRKAKASRKRGQDAATSTRSEPVAESSVNPRSESARQ